MMHLFYFKYPKRSLNCLNDLHAVKYLLSDTLLNLGVHTSFFCVTNKKFF